MTAKAKIFVSHSAKSDTHKKALEKFVQKLRDEDLDPWVDYERIKTGAAWNPEITNGLHECHGAVILFSRAALNSDFVKYEASCLAYRKRTQPAFGLFPMILDNTRVETVAKGFFGAIQFGDYQIGSYATKRDDVICDLKLLDPKIKTPTSAIEGRLLQIFSADNVTPEAIRQVASMDELAWPTWPDVEIPDGEALHFVRCLLAAPLDRQIFALNKIKRALPPEWSIDRIFDLIAPFWVDEDAAVRLKTVQDSKPGIRCAIINGSHANFTCAAYLNRAKPLEDAALLGLTDQQGNVDAQPESMMGGVVSAGRHAEADLVHQVRRALCQHYEVDIGNRPEPDIDKQLDEEIEFDEVSGRPPVEAIHMSENELPALVQLADKFQRVMFVAMTGKSLPQVDANVSECASVIEPELSHDSEQKRHNEEYAYKYWSRKNRLLGVSSG